MTASLESRPARIGERIAMVGAVAAFAATALYLSTGTWVLRVADHDPIGGLLRYAPILAVIATALGAWGRTALAPDRQALVMEEGSVRLPRGRYGLRPKRIPYGEIRSIAWVRTVPLGRPQLLIADRWGLANPIRSEWFAEPTGLSAFASDLERRASADGSDVERAAVLARRRAVAEATLARTSRVTWILCAVILFALAIQFVVDAFELDGLLEVGAAAPWLVWGGDWHRMFTAVVLHAGVAHAALNLLSLALLGPMVERLLGSGRTAAILLASGFTAGLPVLFVGSHAYVGASGAAFGLYGAVVALNVTDRRTLPTPWFQSWPILAVIAGSTLLTPFVLPQIGTSVHLGGLAGGALAALACRPGVDLEGGRIETPRWLPVGVAGLTAVYLAAFAVGVVEARSTTRVEVLRRSIAAFRTSDDPGPGFAYFTHRLMAQPGARRSWFDALGPELLARGRAEGGFTALIAAEYAYRTGDLATAVALQSVFMCSASDDRGLALLAAMRAEALATGVLGPPAGDVTARLDERGGVRVEFGSPPPEPWVLDLHAFENGALRGVLRLVAGVETSREPTVRVSPGKAALGPGPLELVVVDLRAATPTDHPALAPHQLASWYADVHAGSGGLYPPLAD